MLLTTGRLSPRWAICCAAPATTPTTTRSPARWRPARCARDSTPTPRRPPRPRPSPCCSSTSTTSPASTSAAATRPATRARRGRRRDRRLPRRGRRSSAASTATPSRSARRGGDGRRARRADPRRGRRRDALGRPRGRAARRRRRRGPAGAPPTSRCASPSARGKHRAVAYAGEPMTAGTDGARERARAADRRRGPAHGRPADRRPRRRGESTPTRRSPASTPPAARARCTGSRWPTSSACATSSSSPACARRWRCCPTCPSGALLSVNLSAPDALRRARPRVFAARRLDCERLIVEVTEEALARDDGTLADAVAWLRERRASFAVDDIGAGYSGLGQVATLRPRYLKLDRAWSRGLDTDSGRASLIAAMVGYAAATGRAARRRGRRDRRRARGPARARRPAHPGLPARPPRRAVAGHRRVGRRRRRLARYDTTDPRRQARFCHEARVSRTQVRRSRLLDVVGAIGAYLRQ